MPITITSLSKRFISGRSRCCALDGVDLHIADREMVALIGPSGSGKSTLLRHISGLVAGESGGSIAIHGRPVQTDGRIVRDIRGIRAGVGMIFQQFNLVARLSVLDNVLIGALHRQPTWRTLAGIMPRAERVAAMTCLDRVGLADRAMQRAGTLSGGQQQRVAIARALLQGARVILADEPVASLDPNSSERVMRILADINREDGVTVVVTLHQVAYARAYCPRTVALQSGRIVFDGETARLDDRRLRAIYDDALDLEDAPATTTPLAPEPESALAAN